MRASILCLILAVLVSAPITAQETARAAIARAVEEGDLDRAETLLRAQVSQAPSAWAHDLLGVVLSRRGQTDQAERHFRAAIEAEPQHPAYRQHLARLYLLSGREGAALEHLRVAAQAGPLERDLSLRRATLELAAGRASEAARLLTAHAREHDSVQAELWLARMHQERGDDAAALEALTRARRLAPHSEEVLRSYALRALDMQQSVAAILTLEALERMHPEEPEYAYLMGVARLKVGDPAAAAEALARAIERGPARPLAQVALALALNGQKRYADAEAAAREALRLVPENPSALAALAAALESQARPEEAEAPALAALELDPTHAGALLALGMVRMKQERFEEAREVLERSAASDPGSPKVHYQLSLATARLGDRDASAGHLARYRKMLEEFEQQMARLEGRATTESSP